MNRRHAAWPSLAFLASTLCLTGSPAPGEESRGPPRDPIPLAVIDFDYRDTSGEARDQKAEHERRLREFMDALRRDLESGAVYKVVKVDCGTEPCSAMRLTPEELFDATRKAGARLLLFGGVHKMSTLVQWAQAQIIDIEKNIVIDDRHLSFRGDSDDAWRRAEAFLAKKLTEENIPQ
jgi:hypothetical protein